MKINGKELSIQPYADLAGANLAGADLTNANLRGANLAGANLHGVDLRGAYLTYTNLRGADLTDATLRGADLTNANLAGANLRGANLTNTNLHGADLTYTNLTYTNLHGVDLRDTTLRGANLTGADLRGAILEKKPEPKTATEARLDQIEELEETVAAQGQRIGKLEIKVGARNTDVRTATEIDLGWKLIALAAENKLLREKNKCQFERLQAVTQAMKS